MSLSFNLWVFSKTLLTQSSDVQPWKWWSTGQDITGPVVTIQWFSNQHTTKIGNKAFCRPRPTNVRPRRLTLILWPKKLPNDQDQDESRDVWRPRLESREPQLWSLRCRLLTDVVWTLIRSWRRSWKRCGFGCSWRASTSSAHWYHGDKTRCDVFYSGQDSSNESSIDWNDHEIMRVRKTWVCWRRSKSSSALSMTPRTRSQRWFDLFLVERTNKRSFLKSNQWQLKIKS